MLTILIPVRRSVPPDGWAEGVQRPESKSRSQTGPLTSGQVEWLRETVPHFRDFEAKMAALRAAPKMEVGDLYGEREAV